MNDPQVFYTGEGRTYCCPNGHTIQRDSGDSHEESSWLGFFRRGRCSKCEEDWREFIDEHEGNWDAILDKNFPDDPTYFEWKAQRIVDYNRAGRDDTETAYPNRDNFSGLVPWVRVDNSDRLCGARRGANAPRGDGQGVTTDRDPDSPAGGRS